AAARRPSVREAGVAGPKLVGDTAVVLGALILVTNHQGDGRSGGPPFKNTGQDLDLIRLSTLGGVTGLPGFALVQPGLDVAFLERDQRRDALNDATDGRAVTFAPGRKAEGLSEAVAGHGLYP